MDQFRFGRAGGGAGGIVNGIVREFSPAVYDDLGIIRQSGQGFGGLDGILDIADAVHQA